MESDRMTKRIHPASGILLGIQETGREIPTYNLTFLSGFRGSAGRRIGNLFTFVILFVLLGWGASLQAQGSNATGTTIAQQVAVPAYFYPPSYWPQLTSPVGIAIANVSNGPNYGVDPNYASAILNAQQAGVKVLGYVDTGYFGGTSPARLTRLGQSDANSWTTQIERLFPPPARHR